MHEEQLLTFTICFGDLEKMIFLLPTSFVCTLCAFFVHLIYVDFCVLFKFIFTITMLSLVNLVLLNLCATIEQFLCNLVRTFYCKIILVMGISQQSINLG